MNTPAEYLLVAKALESLLGSPNLTQTERLAAGQTRKTLLARSKETNG